MKRIIVLIRFLVIFATGVFADSYDIEAIDSDRRIPTGTYTVTISRIGSNLYEVKYSEYPFKRGDIIKTRYCYEYVYFEEVVIRITSTSGYSIGEIYFD